MDELAYLRAPAGRAPPAAAGQRRRPLERRLGRRSRRQPPLDAPQGRHGRSSRRSGGRNVEPPQEATPRLAFIVARLPLSPAPAGDRPRRPAGPFPWRSPWGRRRPESSPRRAGLRSPSRAEEIRPRRRAGTRPSHTPRTADFSPLGSRGGGPAATEAVCGRVLVSRGFRWHQPNITYIIGRSAAGSGLLPLQTQAPGIQAGPDLGWDGRPARANGGRGSAAGNGTDVGKTSAAGRRPSAWTEPRRARTDAADAPGRPALPPPRSPARLASAVDV